MFLPAISSAIPLPPTLWRGETGRELPEDLSAADVIRYDAAASGRAYDFSPPLWRYLAGVSGYAQIWVTFRREDAERYAPASRVFSFALEFPAVVIATDDAGGFLLLSDADTLMITDGDDDMTDEPADTAQQPDPYAVEIAEGIRAARAGDPEPSGAFGGWHYRFEQELAALPPQDHPPCEDERGALIFPHVVEEWLSEHADNDAWRGTPYDAAAHRDALREGHEPHPASISTAPELGPDAPEYLTSEDLLKNPWNAVAMPLHPDSDALLREEALYAACYCAVGEYQIVRAIRAGEYIPTLYDPSYGVQPDAHEYAEGNWLKAESVVDAMLLHNYRDLGTLRATEGQFAESAKAAGVDFDNPAHVALHYRADRVSHLEGLFEERAQALPLIDKGDGFTPPVPGEHQALSQSPAIEDEDERKKSGPSGPAETAQLAYNIRPDVESAPGGLVTVTTAKNSERDEIIEQAPRPWHPEAHPEPAPINDRLAARLARIEGQDSGPVIEQGRVDDLKPVAPLPFAIDATELRDVHARQADESTKQQEAERQERAGESTPANTAHSLNPNLVSRLERIEREERETAEVREVSQQTPEGREYEGVGREP